MKSKSEVLAAIKGNKKALAKFGIKSIGLFGSYARESQNEESDIDILLDFEGDKETFDNYMATYDLLESLFNGKRVEVVTKNGLSPYIGPKILNEVIYV
ncbi:nucleotidyltransferase family protein [Parapedobacter soli]|uniref:nucleotidyltransferase family protein n=1 Tax=Parapedobacter soli TaxID=416955 RepID=UPI0021C9A4E5|nr:nucleotidyltransferase family protein [Parapedobacter soli]